MRRTSSHAVAVLILIGLASCGTSEAVPGTVVDDFDPSCAGAPQLHVKAFTCWGEAIDEEASSLPAPFLLGVDVPRDIAVEIPGVGDASVTVSWSGEASREGLNLSISRGYASGAFHGEMRGDKFCPAYTVAVGVEHPWFACQAREPSRNEAELFTSGQSFYASLYADLLKARTRIHGVTWWWQSNFELVRPDNHATLTTEERTLNTTMSVLESLPEVTKRITVARFTPNMATGMAYMNTDLALRSHFEPEDDAFEIMSQGNPTPVPLVGSFTPLEHPIPFVERLLERNPELAELGFVAYEQAQSALEVTVEGASYHQKAWVIDGETTYIGGMNIKSTDWDTDEHDPFEVFRMKFDSTLEERQAVLERRALPDLGPRKDYGMKVAGPAAHAADAVMQERWDFGRVQGEMYSEKTTPFELLPAPPEVEDGVLLQVQATMPEPFSRRSILESMDKAIRNAKDFIYIEDQYFRMPVLLDAFEEAFANSPDLYVVVVTKPVSMADGALKWSIDMNDQLESMANGRYLLLTMTSYGEGYLEGTDSLSPVFAPMDIHAKMLMVDNKYMNVGSCNKNNRGLLLEGELNVAVLDETFVKSAKQRVLGLATGRPGTDWTRSGAVIFAEMKALAAQNQARMDEATESGEPLETEPEGFLYPLDFGDEYLLEVGPDMF